MPITRSAKKALRAAARKRGYNLARQNKVEKAVKAVRKLVAEGKGKDAAKEMAKVQQALDKAAKMGTYSKNYAARKKSRLMASLKKLGK